MRESKKNGKKIGLQKGTILTTEKSIKCKEIIGIPAPLEIINKGDGELIKKGDIVSLEYEIGLLNGVIINYRSFTKINDNRM